MRDGRAGVAHAKPGRDRVGEPIAAAWNSEQAARLVDDDQPGVFEHDAGLAGGDRVRAEHRRRRVRDPLEHEGQERTALAAARWIELAGTSTSGDRRRARPELGERQRTQAEAVGMAEQLGAGAIAGARRWL